MPPVNLTREQGLNISISSIASFLGVLGVVWVVIQPVIIQTVSASLADEIEQAVKQQVSPISAGFIVLLQQQILQTQREIAQLERIRNANPQAWSSEQATTLVDAYSRLSAQKMALEALQ